MTGVIILLVGMAVGSFLNLCIDRVPAGESLLRPRSRCDACRRPLAARDLIPVASYVALGGRCRHCAAPIPLRALAVEAGIGLIFLALWWGFGTSMASAAEAVGASIATAVVAMALERPGRRLKRKASHERSD